MWTWKMTITISNCAIEFTFCDFKFSSDFQLLSVTLMNHGLILTPAHQMRPINLVMFNLWFKPVPALHIRWHFRV